MVVVVVWSWLESEASSVNWYLVFEGLRRWGVTACQDDAAVVFSRLYSLGEDCGRPM